MPRVLAVTLAAVIATVAAGPQQQQQSDDRATALAEATLEAMGGAQQWDQTRYIVWENFGQKHWWDKWTGDFRWEREGDVAIVNLHSMNGRYWADGSEITDQGELESRLMRVYSRWVNNSYWLLMPYKLLDPGVDLAYMGEDSTMTGQFADVLELTFDDVGLTPYNKYRVYIDKESGYVCQWTHWRSARDEEPRFTLPWTDWSEYNGIMLSTGRGGNSDIETVEVPETLPTGIFSSLE